MLPIDASAPMSCKAALRLAKVSGKLVPIAIIVIPVTLFFRPTTQPRSLPSWGTEMKDGFHKIRVATQWDTKTFH